MSCSETPRSRLSALAKGTPHPRNPTQQPPSEASRPGQDQEAMLSPSGSHLPPEIVDGVDFCPQAQQPPIEAGQDQESMPIPSGSHFPPENVDGSPPGQSPGEGSHPGQMQATVLSCSGTSVSDRLQSGPSLFLNEEPAQALDTSVVNQNHF